MLVNYTIGRYLIQYLFFTDENEYTNFYDKIVQYFFFILLNNINRI